jgi:hypothetical protein
MDRAARAASFIPDAAEYHILQFPFSIPGMGWALAVWNRAVLGRLPRGRWRGLGREVIVRFVKTS